MALKIYQGGRIEVKFCLLFYLSPLDGPENFSSIGPASFAAQRGHKWHNTPKCGQKWPVKYAREVVLR